MAKSGEGTYTLTFGSGTELKSCAAIATVNENGQGANAERTSAHVITVKVYFSGSLKNEAFSIMIAC